MRCLTDVELQAVVDDEATEASRAHAACCESCGARLDARRQQMGRLAALVAAAGDPSPALEARVRRAVTSSPAVRGATALRSSAPRSRRPLWASALATAAAIALVVFAGLPKLGAPTSLSASQIIGRSLEQMTGGHGVEILEYELMLSSTARQRDGLPEGPFRIYQAFDRANPGRFKFAQFGPDGVLQSASSQDPARGRLSQLMRVDGRNYIVHVNALPGPQLSLPEILQAQAESVLTMMQSMSNDHLTVVDGPEGRQYVIELPEVPATTTAMPLDLYKARVVIDGHDFRVREFTASGVLLKQPFDVSFTLIQQIKAAAIAPAEWEIAVGPDDVVIEGESSGEPLADVMSIVLRELGKTRDR
jgi:hypothetical protein